MQHVKFQDNRVSRYGEHIFFILPNMGSGGHLGHVTWTIITNFLSGFGEEN